VISFTTPPALFFHPTNETLRADMRALAESAQYHIHFGEHLFPERVSDCVLCYSRYEANGEDGWKGRGQKDLALSDIATRASEE